MNYRLAPVSAADEARLEQFRRDVYQELFYATWGAWDESRHLRYFAECQARGNISLIELDGVRIGMIQIFDHPDAVEIGEIQIQPGEQNRGIGTRVLGDIIARAHSERKKVSLAVALKNDRAYRLYKRLGFRQVAQTETHNHMAYEAAL